MAARLGNVLYWLACLIAIGSIAVGVFVPIYEPHKDWIYVVVPFGLLALVVWLIGRAIRYVLAGR